MEQVEGCYGCRMLARRAADAQATIAALQDTIMQMGGQAAVLAKDAMAAKEQVAALQRERDRLAELVRQAQPHVCSLLCPSVKARHELWTHTKLCLNMQAALTPAGGGKE